MLGIRPSLYVVGLFLCGIWAVADEPQAVSEQPTLVPPMADSFQSGQVPPRPSAQRIPVVAQPPARAGKTPVADAVNTKQVRKDPQVRPVAGVEELPPAEPSKPTSGDEPIKPETATFKQVEPGKTTADELNLLWDPPREIQSLDGIERRVYKMEHFSRVEVDLEDNVIISILINLTEAVPAQALARDLQLSEIQPVIIIAPSGELLGQAYPERGVMFTYTPETENHKHPKVQQIVLEEIRPEPFVLRAESNLAHDYQASLNDIEMALELAPDYTRAHWLKAQVYAAMGDFPQALRLIATVIEHEPENPIYRLTRADILEHLGDMKQAQKEMRGAIELAADQPLLQARALVRLGDQLATGGQRDYTEAMQMHQEALNIAQPLLEEKHPPIIRQAAQELLIDAYLGIAVDIAWGRWKNKEKAVPQWFERALKLIDSPSMPEDLKTFHKFRLATKALWSYVGMNHSLPDETWCQEVLSNGEKLKEMTPDKLRRQQLSWQIGSAMQDAMQLYLVDGQHELAEKYGEIAIEHLEDGFDSQKHLPGTEYLLGRCYFRVGSIYALRDGDHKQALKWYEKALPLLQKPIPDEAVADKGRQGETFVSMGVAFWKTEKQDTAIELTEKGLMLMQTAVEEGFLEPQDLRIPYRNLYNMHRHLGQDAKAQAYAKLASQVLAPVISKAQPDETPIRK